ncbi:MAG: hypothetical protein SVO01_01180 [Thermotogota bacterium]|nr:hypothetical protein [Thermotogota bacterium]
MGEMAILGTNGDTKVIWDPENEDEVSAAEEQFDNLISKGFKAFKVKKDGDKSTQIKKFNPDLGKIIMTPALVGG